MSSQYLNEVNLNPFPENASSDYLRNEVKKILFHKITKENECKELNKESQILRNKILELEKENNNLNFTITTLQKTESDLNKLKIKCSQWEEENIKLQNNIKSRELEYRLEKEKLKNEYNIELTKIRNENSNMGNKVENIKSMELFLEAQKNQILDLENEKEKIITTNAETLNKKHLQNELKFGELKKKMKTKLEKTKSQVMELNEHNIDVATKITLMQNTQLLVELRYQLDQDDELRKSKKKLELENESLKAELNLHNEIETTLMEKNKRLLEKLNKANNFNKDDEISPKILFSSENSKDGAVLGSKSSSNFINSSVNNNIRDFIHSSNLEKKINDLENTLEINQRDYQNLKLSNNLMKEKIENFEKKFTNIFILLEEGLTIVSEMAEESKNEAFISYDKLKKGNFEGLTKEQKYQVIHMFMKSFMPLVNPFDLQNSEAFNFFCSGKKSPYERQKEKKQALQRNHSQESLKMMLPSKSSFLNNSSLTENKSCLPAINTLLHNTKTNISIGQLYQNRKNSIFS